MKFKFFSLSFYLFSLLKFSYLSYNIIVRGDIMFHLNNRGWGLSVLLAFLLIFFVAIILISIGASNLGIALIILIVG